MAQRDVRLCLGCIYIVASVLVSPGLAFWRSGGDSSDTCPAFGKRVERYSIMFDAGSTGTRMYVFKFEISFLEVRLLDEVVMKTTLPISAVTHIGDHLKPLLKKAEKTVPSSKRSVTPIVLLATAGLRLRDDKFKEKIFEAVRKSFKSSSFRSGKKAVGILDGVNEGFYCFLTVAYALDNMRLINVNIAVLDLGGGSMQVTFIPKELETFNKKDHLHKFIIPGQRGDVKMYAHSYYAGLMHSRAEIFMKNSGIRKGSSHSINVTNSCVHPGLHTLMWMYMGMTFNVTADFEKEFSFQNCHQIVKDYVADLRVFAPKELAKMDLYLTSFYYTIAVEVGLISRKDWEKVIHVEDFKMKAETECSSQSKTLKGAEFTCLELTYIYSFLHDGLGLQDDKELHVVTKIKKIEVSWALGAALISLLG
ncbi:ectonucleoside triphosphate diphosphohydrolase 5-like [Tropilaelaps mercedesae]|uniref:Ectonucleoside triphosphate diphosphohydrolase 5-like n=1 Tax=Tropilaelaps mercedesae TaxID=418985 RepID=A0A1V9XIH9_9ACAR|nr:ectonucleoside triphosphate diphosphohydrolase 5-like [Tropilaelaps mercedesae]